MKSITATELAELLKTNAAIQLIDVREPYEHEDFNIGGLLIPLGEITQNTDKIDKDKPVVIYCHHGIRSQVAIQRLTTKYPYKNLMNLVGGTAAWENAFGRNFQ